MTTKNLVILGAVAVVLGGAAVALNGKPSRAPSLNGKAVLPALDLSAVAKIDLGERLALVAGTNGWTLTTYQDYPADRAKLTENLLKLGELKVGQVVRGKTLAAAETVPLVLRDAAGQELARLALGPKHAKWGHGRYAVFAGETVLLSDALDAFGDDPKTWIDTKLADDPWISFSRLAEPSLTEDELGFKTGVVAKVTCGADTNRVLTVGAAVKGGSDRYVKVAGQRWTYVVPAYSVERLLPKEEAKDKAKDADKAKPAAKKEEASAK